MIGLDEIDSIVVEDIENPSHPSEFVAQERYNVLILRLPEVVEGEISISSLAFVFSKEGVTLFNRQSRNLESLGGMEEFVKLVDSRTQRLTKDLQRYHFDIDMLEESLFKDSHNDLFMQQWLHYKKDASLIYRLMFHAALAFELFLAHHRRNSSQNLLMLDDINSQIERIRDLAKAAMEKLENLYDFYRAKVDERMNKNMYYLTLISGIFLPLTLVTGFFGMNSGGLPFVDDPSGTLKVVLLATLLEVVMLVLLLVFNSQKIRRFKRDGASR